jgi:hypothetical protein
VNTTGLAEIVAGAEGLPATHLDKVVALAFLIRVCAEREHPTASHRDRHGKPVVAPGGGALNLGLKLDYRVFDVVVECKAVCCHCAGTEQANYRQRGCPDSVLPGHVSPRLVTFVIIELVINLDDNQLLAAHPGGFYKSLPTGIESPVSLAGTRLAGPDVMVENEAVAVVNS